MICLGDFAGSHGCALNLKGKEKLLWVNMNKCIALFTNGNKEFRLVIWERITIAHIFFLNNSCFYKRQLRLIKIGNNEI